MRVGNRQLKLSSGKVVTFASNEKRENFEKYAQAIKHGWRPTGKGKRSK